MLEGDTFWEKNRARAEESNIGVMKQSWPYSNLISLNLALNFLQFFLDTSS